MKKSVTELNCLFKISMSYLCLNLLFENISNIKMYSHKVEL